jgi:hypothetical protein
MMMSLICIAIKFFQSPPVVRRPGRFRALRPAAARIQTGRGGEAAAGAARILFGI